MNIKKQLIGMATIMLMIFTSGCAATATTPTPDLASTIAVNVAVEQTMAAMKAQSAFTATAYQEQHPTETPTLQATATSEYTPTPDKVTLTLSKDTYCRNGIYAKSPLVTLFTAGQTVDVVGVDPNNEAYYVVEPNHTFTNCWVWGEFANVSGNISSLPVYTPQPLPTPTRTPTVGPDFTASYVGLQTCGSDYYLRFFVKNNGSKMWQSLQINITDNSNNTTTSFSGNAFIDYTGCSAGILESDLVPGESSNVAAYPGGKFTTDPTGHSMTATIILCQNDTLSGCDPRIISFTP